MALPRPNRPEYSTTVPSSGKKIKYQPFTVREEKILVLAAESQDTEEISSAVSNCLKNCVVSPQDFNVESLAIFDIEYLFLKCRAKSIGEKINLRLTDPDDETFTTTVEVNIDKIAVEKNKNHSDLIKLSDDLQVKMNYPDISFFTEGIDISNLATGSAAINKCLGSIVHGEEVFARNDLSSEEISEWVDELSTENYNKLLSFFTTMPRLTHTIKAMNENNGKEFSVTLEGLSDFF